nr:reverse transcriptase domain-containing protein [Tanacetum cinerariifolium]
VFFKTLDQTSNSTSSTNPTPKGRIRRSSKQKVENSNSEENPLPPVPTAENQTMAQLLQAPTDGYEDAIVIPEIAANNFELKHGLINLVQNKQFFGHEKEDPHAHLRYFNKITSTMRVSSNSSTPAVSADVAELKDMVRALLLDKKNQYSAQTSSPTTALIKVVEPNCVTCGGGNFNQSNFNQSQLTRPQVNQPLAYQAPAYLAPVSQTQSVSKTNFESYVKANDAVLRNIHLQGQSTQNQCQRSGTLPGNTVTNPKEDLKGITTRSALIGNKEKLSEMARTPMNEHCSMVILNKLPKKLGDPKKFLIPCEFPGMDECLALADLGASINLMPLSVCKGLSLPELTPTCMTLELADHSVSKPIGIAKDVSVKTSRALIDVYKGELTLRIRHKSITYNLDQTSRYSANYDQMTAIKIDVTEEACEEYSQEVLGFFDVTASGSPTPSDDLIVPTTFPTLTPFGDSDFLLFEEVDAFLAILNSVPSPPLLNHEKSVPSFKEELKACEAKTIKSSIDEPPEVELKDLPPHLEYTFLECDNKLPVIIAKALKDEDKSALIKVLKSHKQAIAWKLSDIQGINLEFCTHKILMEEDYKPAV